MALVLGSNQQSIYGPYECQSQYYCLNMVSKARKDETEKSGRIMFLSYRLSGPDEWLC